MRSQENKHAQRNGNVNFAGRVNKVVASNVGGKGSLQATSSTQKVRIRQDRDGTQEHVETVERSTWSPEGDRPPLDEAVEERNS